MANYTDLLKERMQRDFVKRVNGVDMAGREFTGSSSDRQRELGGSSGGSDVPGAGAAASLGGNMGCVGNRRLPRDPFAVQ